MRAERVDPSSRASSTGRSPRAIARLPARDAASAGRAGSPGERCSGAWKALRCWGVGLGVLLLDRISLEDVSLRKIIEIRQRDAAVVAAGHLTDVVLEPLQVGDAAASHLLAGAQHAAHRVAGDPAVDDMGSRERGLAVDGEEGK